MGHKLDLYRAYQGNIIKDIYPSTIQFFKFNDKENAKAFGTGVLVEVDGHHFVFTAGHVIDKEEQNLWVPIGGDDLIRLGGQYLTNSSYKRNHDDIDIGVIVLTDSTVTSLKNIYSFIPKEEITVDHEFVNRQEYVVLGYPATKTKANYKTNKLITTVFSYITGAGASSRYKRMNCNPDHRVLVHYDRRSVLNLKTGRTQQGPNSHGMSGCGLWHVPSQGFALKTGEKRLVAILTDWPNGSWWIGTRIEVFSEFVRQRFDLDLPMPQHLKVSIDFGALSG